MERAPCGYLSTTPDGTIVAVNTTLLRWTGHDRDDLVGRRTFSSLLSAGGRIYHDTHYGPMLRLQDAVREIALDVVRADGSRFPVLVNAALDRDETGRPSVVRIVVFDATERREYERELLRAKERAEQSEARARSLARTLQATLIPPRPPEIPGLDVQAAYRPAGDGEEVGGDFYDVFQVDADDWAVVLGDVCGKGIPAAILTSLVRHSVRALSVEHTRPDQVLHGLNTVLLNHGSDRFATVVLLRLRRLGDSWRVDLSLGGHPHPLMLRPGAPPEPLGSPGSLVGLFGDPEYHHTEARLDPGDSLVLYTDGVIEGRCGDAMYGDSGLLGSIGRHRREGSLAALLLDDVLEFQNGVARDDIAIVTVAAPPPR